MTQSMQNALDKWSSLMGDNKVFDEYKSTDNFILPAARQIFAKTVGLDIVSINPMPGPGGTSKEEMDRIEAEVKRDNRESKIDAVIEGKEYKEKTVKDHPDYKKPTGGNLLYMDFKYDSDKNNEE